jgi:hypothetical protein
MMSSGTTTDDEIIGRLRDQERRARRVVYVIALAPVVGCALAVFCGRGQMSGASWWAVGAAGALVVTGLAWLAWQRPSPAAYGARIVARRTDEIQRGRARQLWVFPLEVLCLAPQIVAGTRHVLDRGGPRLLGLPAGIATTSYLLVLTSALLVMAVVTLMMLMGAGYPRALRAVMDDELSRAQRAKAIASGFTACLVGGLAAFAAGLVEPRWAVLSLPFVVTGSLAIAAVHFAILDRRADLSG